MRFTEKAVSDMNINKQVLQPPKDVCIIANPSFAACCLMASTPTYY